MREPGISIFGKQLLYFSQAGTAAAFQILQLTHLEMGGRPNEQEVMSKSWVQAARCQGYDFLVYIEILHLRLGSIQLVRAVDAYLATCSARRGVCQRTVALLTGVCSCSVPNTPVVANASDWFWPASLPMTNSPGATGSAVVRGC